MTEYQEIQVQSAGVATRAVKSTAASTSNLLFLTTHHKRDHPVWVARTEMPQGWRELVDADIACSVRPLSAIRWAWKMFRARKRYAGILTGSETVAHVFAMLQSILPRRQRVPHVLVDFPWNPPAGGFRLLLKRLQYRIEARAISKIVVHGGPEEEASFASALGIAVEKFIFIPYHATTFRNVVSRGDYIFAGGDSFRDYVPLVEAMRELPYRLVIATNRRQQIEQQVHVPSNVEFVKVGPGEFDKLIAGCRMVVNPVLGGLVHGAGQSILLNALAYGKPVIMTDDGHVRNYVIDGHTALLVPPKDAEALRTAITRLLDDRVLEHDLAQNALEASQNYTPERFFERVFALIDAC